MKYIKRILTMLMIISGIIYIFNTENKSLMIFLQFLIALQNTVIFIELNRENKKKESISYAFIAILFWVIVFVGLYF